MDWNPAKASPLYMACTILKLQSLSLLPERESCYFPDIIHRPAAKHDDVLPVPIQRDDVREHLRLSRSEYSYGEEDIKKITHYLYMHFSSRIKS